MKIFLTTIAIGLFVIIMSCTSESSSEATQARKPLNPNGDSELAILMRELYNDGERIKSDILAGKKPVIHADYAAVLTATATEPEKAASPAYHAFAQTYIETMKALEKASAEDAGQLYVSMVKTCMDCHTRLCPGPKMRIRKLEL